MDEAIARQRYQILLLIRVFGIALVILGALIWKTALVGAPDARVGRGSVAAGLVAGAVLPPILRRRWRRGR